MNISSCNTIEMQEQFKLKDKLIKVFETRKIGLTLFMLALVALLRTVQQLN